MQIFVINLDRNPLRWKRMAGLLAGLNFKRISAVDGKNLEGPEFNSPGHPPCPKTLARYVRGCLLSHRAVYQEFLAGPDPYCCVLEDDIYVSPDFYRFTTSTEWIPTGYDVVKLETARQEVRLSAKAISCLDRQARQLYSYHFGTAAYVISRKGAQRLLELTGNPDRPIDRILFEESALAKHPAYQLVPALCVQSSHRDDEIPFSEMESTIQPKAVSLAAPARTPAREAALEKIRRELVRPLRQLARLMASSALRLQGIRRFRVPFA